MYNEYPDLILEGLMYDLNIVTEADTENKNIFQKFVAFLKRIGQWFVKIFKKIAEKFKKVESKESNGELTDEKLSSIKVTNYDTEKIQKFIERSDKWLYGSLGDEICNIRNEIMKEEYKDINKVQEYIEKVEIFYNDSDNYLITDFSQVNKFKKSFDGEKVECNLNIYNFMVETFKNMEKEKINKVASVTAKSYEKKLNDGIHTTRIKDFPKLSIADSRMVNAFTIIMNLSAKILQSIYTDLVNISNKLNNATYKPDYEVHFEESPKTSY